MSAKAVKEDFGLVGNIDQAMELLKQMTTAAGDADTQVPPWVLKEARGLVFLFTYKVGVFASISGGTGLVVRRTEGKDTWCAPVAIGIGGGGGGLDFGVNKTSQLIVLRTDSAVDTFLAPDGSGKVSIGMNFAAGPVGRQVEEAGHFSKTGEKATNAFTYALTKGLFAGVGIQGSYLKDRSKENRQFYKLADDADATPLTFSKIERPSRPMPEKALEFQKFLKSTCDQ